MSQQQQKASGTKKRAKLQDTRLTYTSQLLACIPVMNNWDFKFKNTIPLALVPKQ